MPVLRPHPPARRRPARRLALCLALLLAASSARAQEPARRVVSLNPSLSQILLALGAGEVLVGVDEVSQRLEPRLADLPSVGGLFDPSLESVVALEPDLVVLVPSIEQRNFRGRLEALGVRTVGFRNIRFEEVLANIADLGVLVGREVEADRRIAEIRATREAVERVASERAPVRCLVVLQRDPVFVAASGSFLDEMLTSAGCRNLAHALGEGYPRASLEWVVTTAPDAILDMSLDAGLDGAREGKDGYWQRWPTLPAVANDRVLHVDAELVTMPGPELDRSLRTLARALHGASIDLAIDRAIEQTLAARVGGESE
jgi:iron complex transport system substrate-binding protein